jgi:hypothetical protein
VLRHTREIAESFRPSPRLIGDASGRKSLAANFRFQSCCLQRVRHAHVWAPGVQEPGLIRPGHRQVDETLGRNQHFEIARGFSRREDFWIIVAPGREDETEIRTGVATGGRGVKDILRATRRRLESLWASWISWRGRLPALPAPCRANELSLPACGSADAEGVGSRTNFAVLVEWRAGANPSPATGHRGSIGLCCSQTEEAMAVPAGAGHRLGDP